MNNRNTLQDEYNSYPRSTLITLLEFYAHESTDDSVRGISNNEHIGHISQALRNKLPHLKEQNA